MASQQTGRGIKNKRWRARIRVKGREVYLGTFDSQEEAEEEEDNEREAIGRPTRFQFS